MSVNINWNSLEQESLLSWSKQLLNDALNSGKRPSILASDIEIKDLHFGHNSPIVEILEIGDLDSDKFRGIFKIKYTGDSYINLATKIQANPMNIFHNNSLQKYSDFILPDLSLVNQNFKIPINLKLSKIMLSGIIIIVFNKSKGLTLVFKNDPLENISVSSTFDAIPAIRNFLQAQIENQIRDLFREILPNVLYKVSQKWTKNIHSQLLSTNSTKNEREKMTLLSEINPDGPELSPANLLRLSTLSASRQSLSLSIPIIQDYIQRSTVEKFLNDNMLNNNQNSFFLMNKLAKDFNNLPFNNNKYSNSLPIELFTNDGGITNDYGSIEKSIVDVSKYQSMSYKNKNQTNNKQVKKPKRRVIKLKSKKSSNKPDTFEITSRASTVVTDTQEEKHAYANSVAGDSNDSIADGSTLIDDTEIEFENDNALSMSNLSIDTITNKKLREKRALSSSSASVEYLRSLYIQEQKENKLKDQKKAGLNKQQQQKQSARANIKAASSPSAGSGREHAKRPIIISQLSGHDNSTDLGNSLKNQSMLGLSLGLNNSSIINSGYQNNSEKKVSREKPTNQNGESITLKLSLNLNDKIRNEKLRERGYYKKFSNLNEERKLPSVDFFTPNPVFSDIPPPYVP